MDQADLRWKAAPVQPFWRIAKRFRFCGGIAKNAGWLQQRNDLTMAGNL